MSELTGVVFDLQRAALHDGPGIRSTVFLKGCALRCVWCHNPESFALPPQTVQGEHGPRTFGRIMSVRQVMDEVVRDLAYYQASGGGMTLSGGEPTIQFEFCLALLQAAHDQGIHTCLDTSGHCPPERLRMLLPLTDLFLFDYKATGAATHGQLTGQPNELILANLDLLYQAGADILLRCPMIPGRNATPEHFAALGALARHYPRLRGIDILPYHRAGQNKYALLGLPEPRPEATVPDGPMLEQWRGRLTECGVASARIR